MSRRRLLAAVAFAAMSAAAAGAQAQSIAYVSPNFINVPGATTATLRGVTHTNQGLQGSARLPANLHDFNGETLRSFSGMALDLSTWRRNADEDGGMLLRDETGAVFTGRDRRRAP